MISWSDAPDFSGSDNRSPLGRGRTVSGRGHSLAAIRRGQIPGEKGVVQWYRCLLVWICHVVLDEILCE